MDDLPDNKTCGNVPHDETSDSETSVSETSDSETSNDETSNNVPVIKTSDNVPDKKMSDGETSDNEPDINTFDIVMSDDEINYNETSDNVPEIEMSDDIAIDSKEILNGLFGNDNDENDIELTTVHSDWKDGYKMDTVVNKSCNTDIAKDEKTDATEKISIEKYEVRKEESAENMCFGSHILGSKSTNINHTDLSSFAAISENYDKSMISTSEVLNISTENSTNCNQMSSGLDSKVTTFLPKNSLQSLSIISTNYQDSSSSESENSSSDNDPVQYGKWYDSDEGSLISLSSADEYLKKKNLKTKGELDISDLPPIEDLKISLNEEKCKPMGSIKSIVDSLVIVEAFVNQSALDIDSVLFIDRGERALGKIFDVFGPVSKPFYAVRFNNSEHIKTFNLLIKEPVFCAPETEYANFILVSKLMQIKGSDASWKDNNEPPPQFIDYSDDEAERQAKKKKKKKNIPKENGADDENEMFVPPDYQSTVSTVHTSSTQNHNRPQRAYTPCYSSSPIHTPSYSPQPTNFNPRPLNFRPRTPNWDYNRPRCLTYAQRLSAMENHHSYQEFNPWREDQNIYPPRHNYPYQQPYRPPRFNIRSQTNVRYNHKQ